MLENSNNVIKMKIILLSIMLIVDFFLNYGLAKFNKIPVKLQDIIRETFITGLCVITSISIYFDLKTDTDIDYFDALCITGITSLVIGIYYFMSNIEKDIINLEDNNLKV
jgi:hypothetical protein